MCGIAGILRVHAPGQAPPPPHAAIPEAWLDLLDDSIKHRGPDGQGRFRERALRPDGSVVDVALVHRRLSIIDHAGGAQPMVLGGPPLRAGGSVAGASGSLRSCPRCAALGKTTIAVVFNGCIYNHRELRRELQAAGHEFSTDHSDTEVLVHGWGEWAHDLATRLEAMFAYVVWDGTTGSMTGFRDRFGEKPLYFHDGLMPEEVTAFASAAPALLRLPWKDDPRLRSKRSIAYQEEVRRRWISHGYWDCPPVANVGTVDAGSAIGAGVATAPLTLLRVRKMGSIWWGDWRPPAPSRDQRPPANLFDELLSDAVARRLEADVPIGCFLSGGIDSSLIALHAHRHCPDIHAFTVRMPDSRFDESAIAARVAERIGITHEVLDCHAKPADDLVRLIHQLGLPFGDSSLLPTYWVSKAAAARVKVALSGDGGDELFAGYRRYQAAHLLGYLGGLRHLLWPIVPFVREGPDPTTARARRARFVNAAVRGKSEDLPAIFPRPLINRVMLPWQHRPWYVRPLLAGILALSDVISPAFEIGFSQAVAGAIAFDLRWYLPEDILRKTDTASMAVPLEVRAPFLDGRLADAALATIIPGLMPRGQRKGLLRAVARKYFPPEIVDRPKQGFAIPIGDWFRSDYGGMRQLLLDHLHAPEPFGPERLGINSMINMGFVKRMLREHDDAGAKSLWPWKGRDHSQRLYMLLVLSIWGKWLGSI